MREVRDSTEYHRNTTNTPRRSAAFDGEPGMIAEARCLTRGFLTQVQSEYGIPVSPRLSGDTQLVVSELLTNVLKYAPGPCLLDLQLDADAVEITVWDSQSALPLARAADPGRVGQHGIEIVLAVCQGFDVRREPVGKRVKVRIAVADAQH